MKIFCISDTHGMHSQVNVPTDIDMIIHAGDVGNSRYSDKSHSEILDFLFWYQALNVKYKIFIAGNHDTAFTIKDYVKIPSDIIYLQHEAISIEGINIFGSPYTPTFGNWSFMKDRSKLQPYWDKIPDNTDILITHGPPKGILDLSIDPLENLQFCGDKALLNSVLKVQPKLHIFGHIHDGKDVINNGIRTLIGCRTKFINASCVEDGKFSKGIVNNGHLIEL